MRCAAPTSRRSCIAALRDARGARRPRNVAAQARRRRRAQTIEGRFAERARLSAALMDSLFASSASASQARNAAALRRRRTSAAPRSARRPGAAGSPSLVLLRADGTIIARSPARRAVLRAHRGEAGVRARGAARQQPRARRRHRAAGRHGHDPVRPAVRHARAAAACSSAASARACCTGFIGALPRARSRSGPAAAPTCSTGAARSSPARAVPEPRSCPSPSAVWRTAVGARVARRVRSGPLVRRQHAEELAVARRADRAREDAVRVR